MLFEEEHSGNQYFRNINFVNLYSVTHCHRSFEVLLVLEGTIRASIREESHILTAGNAIWILPYEIHSYQTIGYSRCFISLFSMDFIMDFYEYIKDKTLQNPVFSFTERELEALRHTQEPFRMKSVLYHYCSELLQQGTDVRTTAAADDLMCRILLYIQEHYRDGISLKELSAELGYHYHYMSAYFNAHFGMGFSEYVNRFRLEEALRLLENTQESISQIALGCGFSTIRNFNLAFQKRYHTAPNKWREESKGYHSPLLRY